MLKQLASSLWIKRLDNQLASSKFTTCRRFVIIQPGQAMRMHPDIALKKIQSLIQQVCIFKITSTYEIKEFQKYYLQHKRPCCVRCRTRLRCEFVCLIQHGCSCCKYRLSHEGPGDVSFIARGTISYFVTSERSERETKYDIVTKAIKLILPSLECENISFTYLCLHQSYSGAKIKFYFLIINNLISFPNECKHIVKNTLNSWNFAKTSQE